MFPDVRWTVLVDGKDMSSAMQPYVLSVTVQDKDGTAGDTCQMVFDDSGGQLEIPNDKASVKVFIKSILVFEGTVSDVNSTASRTEGRKLSVSAKGFDTKGKVKDGQRWHMDDATLNDALSKSAEKAGLSGIKVDDELGRIKRNYWSPDGSSFLAWGQRLAREHNATFKIRGDKAVFAKRGKDLLPSVLGIVGKNVIGWNIKPIQGRRKFKKATAQYFDRAKATFETEEVEIGQENTETTNALRSILADKDQAKENLKARKSEAERESGEGTVDMDIEVTAQAEAPFILTGARPGVDGIYRIVTVTHKGTRNSGTTTSLALKQPKPD